MTDAPDPAARVSMLIALTEQLTAIISRENELLESRRPAELSALQPEKARLAAAYAQSIRTVAEDRASVSRAGDALISELRALTETFEARARRQRALLEAARAAGESLVRAIADEAASRAEPGYAVSRDAAPIAVDEKA
jgi:hypothetical protein